MSDSTASQNKAAWEYHAYEWRIIHQGTAAGSRGKDNGKPEKSLRYHAGYFNNVNGKHVAGVCGSDGRRALALALLNAGATVFDISEPQKKYALELAKAAGVTIGYEIGDFCDTDVAKHGEFNEHYRGVNQKRPGEFTLIAKNSFSCRQNAAILFRRI
jgi:hypothetical protein